MKLGLFVAAAAPFVTLVTLVCLAGCSSNNSSGGSNAIFCSQTVGGTESCAAYKNFPSQDQSSISSSCTQTSGTVVASCPTANLTGCCTTNTSGYELEQCYYGSTGGSSASSLQSVCTSESGTWSTSQ